jgi:uncharacterized membrane protein YhaH (DUF805 family)
MPLSQLLFSSRGRIPRSTFWYYQLSMLGLYFVAYIMDSGLGYYEGSITVVFSLAAIIPTIFVNIKRFHDCNYSGWSLLIGMIPLANIFVFIILGFIKGTVGENKYGPDPLQTSIVSVNYQ